jgi:hypothetical protein
MDKNNLKFENCAKSPRLTVYQFKKNLWRASPYKACLKTTWYQAALLFIPATIGTDFLRIFLCGNLNENVTFTEACLRIWSKARSKKILHKIVLIKKYIKEKFTLFYELLNEFFENFYGESAEKFMARFMNIWKKTHIYFNFYFWWKTLFMSCFWF